MRGAHLYPGCCGFRAKVGLLLATATLAALLVAPNASNAETRIATYTTPGCSGAPIWRIGYRMYFTGGGPALSRGNLPRAKEAANEFTRLVGSFSQCGVRAQVDVYDMGSASWSGDYPADADDFRRRNKYDAGFYRHPLDNPNATHASTNYTDAEFGVDHAQDLDTSSPYGDPWQILLMHEWLHMVVNFYDQVQWPTNDVHGAAEHGYTPRDAYDYPDTRYFADMMSGRVRENGKLLGIKPGQWAYYGTPTRPLHQPSGGDEADGTSARRPRLRIGKGLRRGRHVRFRVKVSPSLVGRRAKVTVVRYRRRCGRVLVPHTGARFTECANRRVGRTRTRRVTLKRSQRLRFRASRRKRGVKLVVSVPKFERNGIAYTSVRTVRRYRRR